MRSGRYWFEDYTWHLGEAKQRCPPFYHLLSLLLLQEFKLESPISKSLVKLETIIKWSGVVCVCVGGGPLWPLSVPLLLQEHLWSPYAGHLDPQKSLTHPLPSCVDAPHGRGSFCLPAFSPEHRTGTVHCSPLPKRNLMSRNSSMNLSLCSFLYDPHRDNSPHIFQNVVVMRIIMTAVI